MALGGKMEATGLVGGADSLGDQRTAGRHTGRRARPGDQASARRVQGSGIRFRNWRHNLEWISDLALAGTGRLCVRSPTGSLYTELEVRAPQGSAHSRIGLGGFG
jgi:hypothetical protein